ncbi:MAG: ribonuclease HII [Victivallaceae bacterium]|nr:ribonuclease HII [Victivallaceae bacterium]
MTADDELLRPERQLWAEGFSSVAGVDEAGRGCLAGPVVAAAVILPRYVDLPGVYDSKQLSDRERRELYRDLLAQPGIVYGWGIVGNEEIDEVNILNATHRAMRSAVKQLSVKPDVVLVDGLPVKDFIAPSRNLVGGDALSASIAAASILAKVRRDDIMIELDKKYPGYGFAGNKGYGTAKHLAALKTLGPCAAHRKTFHPVWEYLDDAPKQLELL